MKIQNRTNNEKKEQPSKDRNFNKKNKFINFHELFFKIFKTHN